MKALLDVIARHGYILSTEIEALEKECPNLLVVIKWAEKPRERVRIKDLGQTIKAGERGSDYAREVFLDSTTFQAIERSIARAKKELDLKGIKI